MSQAHESPDLDRLKTKTIFAVPSMRSQPLCGNGLGRSMFCGVRLNGLRPEMRVPRHAQPQGRGMLISATSVFFKAANASVLVQGFSSVQDKTKSCILKRFGPKQKSRARTWYEHRIYGNCCMPHVPPNQVSQSSVWVGGRMKLPASPGPCTAALQSRLERKQLQPVFPRLASVAGLGRRR